jgi:hypothetical protein
MFWPRPKEKYQMFLLRVFSTCTVICVFSALSLQAQRATCTNWNTWLLNPTNPSKPSPFTAGVNDNRTVVGFAQFSVKPPKGSGFVHYFSGKITYWMPANAQSSYFTGRNNVGNTVGDYVDTLGINHAAYLHGSTITLIVHPKAAHHSTQVTDINNLNTILGYYQDSNGVNHTFKRRSNGTFLSVPTFPGGQSCCSFAAGFNDNGVVVGTYRLNDPIGVNHGFIYRNGSFATVDYRNNKRAGTELVGIDNNGVIVGNVWSKSFLYKHGVFKDIFGPHGELVSVSGISANGVITGGFNGRGFTVNCQ